MTVTRAALRAKRAGRLAQYAQDEGNDDTEDTDEDALVGTTSTDDGQNYEKNAPALGVESAGQQVVATVTPLEQLQASADVDMVLFQYDENDPRWAVFASGEPIAEIRLSDQENSADLRPLFLSKSYAETVKLGCSKDGLQKTLEGIKARPYAARMDKSEVVAKMREDLQADQEDAVREARAEAAQDLMNSLGLVLEAMNKNFIVKNPLKEALYSALHQIGVAAPVQVVEAAFENAGPDFFETAINRAREWAAYNPEAYKQIEDSIQKAAKYTPEMNAAPTSPQMPQAQDAFPHIPQNVPLETKTAGQEQLDPKAALRQRLFLGK